MGPADASMRPAPLHLNTHPKQSLFAKPGANELVLRRRKGFIKVALRTGASLVPVLGFGEKSTFRWAGREVGEVGACRRSCCLVSPHLCEPLQDRQRAALQLAPAPLPSQDDAAHGVGVLLLRRRARPPSLQAGPPLPALLLLP